MSDIKLSIANLVAEQGQRYSDAADKIRQRADISAKALAALGTTLISAVGVAKFVDVFPLPAPDYWPVAFVVLVGFAAMAVAFAMFTARLWKVNRPLFTTSDVETMEDLDPEEKPAVSAVYDEMARLNNAASLWAYEARAHRLERLADETSESETRERQLEKAKLIRAEVLSTQRRAATIVIRRRVSSIATERKTWFIIVLFLFGLVVAGVSADWLESERTGRVAVLKACAEAQKLISEQKLNLTLPAICGTAIPLQPSKLAIPDPRMENATLIKNLAEQYDRCVVGAMANNGSGIAACNEVRTLINERSK